MKINKRLTVIANMIDANQNIIDIGCDHGLLDIYLTLYKNVNCIASDISEKCIEKTLKNIKKYGVEGKIKTVVSDGLKNIDSNEFNRTIIISGMGTHTILEILKNIDVNDLIIQSNSNTYELRKKLIEKGYYIEKEENILDNKIYYSIILFKKGNREYSEMELLFGPFLINNRNYIDYLINKYTKIYNKVTQENKKMDLKKQLEYLKCL